MANDKFMKALRAEPQNCPPVWFMRQAGRYHGHYQNLRKKHGFMELCKNPKLAAEVALGPIEDFDFDVSIMFSDLLFPLEAMGMGLEYNPSPELGWHLREASEIGKLKTLTDCKGFFDFQKEALENTRAVLPENKSVIGFIGGPWTLFCYAVDGSHKGGLKESKARLHLFSSFCETIMPILEHNIEVQLAGGAEVVMVFDTAAGELDAPTFKAMVAPLLDKLSKKFPDKLGYYAKGIVASHLVDLHKTSKFVGFGYDHRWDMTEVLGLSHSGFKQGNFDQLYLFSETDKFESIAQDYLQRIKKLTPEQRAGWVSGLGHGVLPNTPTEHVRKFVKMVREVLA